jgi:hypothetical protein
VIVVAVRWYLRYGLSYRDVEELLAERGVEVDHATVYRWVQRFTPLLADAARFARHPPGDRWFVDETYVKVSDVWRYVYWAVDQNRGGASSAQPLRSTLETVECFPDHRPHRLARPRLPPQCAGVRCVEGPERARGTKWLQSRAAARGPAGRRH